jgi:hypothetical protein
VPVLCKVQAAGVMTMASSNSTAIQLLACSIPLSPFLVGLLEYSVLIKAFRRMVKKLDEVAHNIDEAKKQEMRTQFDVQKLRIDLLKEEYVAGKKVIEEISTMIDGMTTQGR